jgi:hypothetical protein
MIINSVSPEQRWADARLITGWSGHNDLLGGAFAGVPGDRRE